MLEKWCNRDGRAILLKLNIYGKKCTFINLYLPNQNQLKTGSQLISELMEKVEGITIIGGDFNFVLDKNIDTTAPSIVQTGKEKKTFKELMAKYQLVDIWRALHPGEKDFTFHSKVHGSYHRIDYFLINQLGVTITSSAEIGSAIWSDHTPIFLTFDLLKGENIRGNWKLNDNLLYDEACVLEIRKAIMNFSYDHIGDTTSLPIQWEALKCVIRGLFIKYGARLKKVKNNRITQLLKEIPEIEAQHKQSLTREILIELTDMKTELQTLLNEHTLRISNNNRSLYYQQGNKPGKLLARALQNRCKTSPIVKIKTEAGDMRYDPKGILKEFQTFYTKLYNISNHKANDDPEGLQQDIHQYIKETALPVLTPLEVTQLEQEFSEGEIQRVIDSLVPGKSPGPDGFTPRFYKIFKEELIPIIKRTFNVVSTSVPLVPQSLQAYISLIPKPEKDLTLCGNYRPISLTNIDLRLYSKIITNRLTPMVPAYVHLDQVGFIKGREARDNTLKTLTLMEYAQRGSIPSCLLEIDAEKAFDRVGWSFLKETLVQWGLGPVLLDKIMALYQNPTAKIRANGGISEEIPITNGTRQGCPLSPILYILVMEHLLIAVRENKDIQGIKVGDIEYKMSVFADDILLYITTPLISLPNLISEFKRFGVVSNFMVNYNKSEALNINLSNTMVELLRKDFSFKWQVNAIKYLGTYIPTDLNKLQEYNYVPMVQKITNTLQKYEKGTFSWIGRINIIKMDILPKILYILQTIPIFPVTTILKKLRRAIGQFVWAGKTPRISRVVQIRPRKMEVLLSQT